MALLFFMMCEIVTKRPPKNKKQKKKKTLWMTTTMMILMMMISWVKEEFFFLSINVYWFLEGMGSTGGFEILPCLLTLLSHNNNNQFPSFFLSFTVCFAPVDDDVRHGEWRLAIHPPRWSRHHTTPHVTYLSELWFRVLLLLLLRWLVPRCEDEGNPTFFFSPFVPRQKKKKSSDWLQVISPTRQVDKRRRRTPSSDHYWSDSFKSLRKRNPKENEIQKKTKSKSKEEKTRIEKKKIIRNISSSPLFHRLLLFFFLLFVSTVSLLSYKCHCHQYHQSPFHGQVSPTKHGKFINLVELLLPMLIVFDKSFRLYDN